MKKNNLPYSQPHGVKFALASEFTSFTYLRGRIFCKLYNNKPWHSIPEVPGSLEPSVTTTGTKPELYDVSIKFRVSFSESGNLNELMQFVGQGVICSYTSASGQIKCAGTKENYLKITLNQIPGFDGYEVTLTGTQKTPEGFIK